MAIEPETKNWTWVIESACPECGYDGSTVTVRDVPGIIDENTAGWPASSDVTTCATAPTTRPGHRSSTAPTCGTSTGRWRSASS